MAAAVPGRRRLAGRGLPSQSGTCDTVRIRIGHRGDVVATHHRPLGTHASGPHLRHSRAAPTELGCLTSGPSSPDEIMVNAPTGPDHRARQHNPTPPRPPPHAPARIAGRPRPVPPPGMRRVHVLCGVVTERVPRCLHHTRRGAPRTHRPTVSTGGTVEAQRPQAAGPAHRQPGPAEAPAQHQRAEVQQRPPQPGGRSSSASWAVGISAAGTGSPEPRERRCADERIFPGQGRVFGFLVPNRAWRCRSSAYSEP